MTERTVTHATFVLERTYPTPPARVFAAWADPQIKGRWFGGADDAVSTAEFELDFRVGGSEINRGQGPDGQMYTYQARYQDIVPDERILYAFDMHQGERRISVSLSTVEFEPDDGGTRLRYTEQGAYLDGLDTPEQREHGTRELLDALGRVLEGAGVRS
jgi:uncharacterized protein YndB with AHSA1/START domain